MFTFFKGKITFLAFSVHVSVGGWPENQRRRVPWVVSGRPWAHEGSLASQAVGRASLLSLLAAEEGGMVTSEVILQN